MRGLAIARMSARDYRTIAASIVLIMVAIAVLDLSIYPSYHAALANFQLPDALSGLVGSGGSLTSPAGFLSAEFFSWVPLMVAIFMAVAATGTTAGEEASGTLELLLAQPVSRTRILLEKALGLAILGLLTALLSLPAFVVTKLFVDFDLSNARILAALVNMVPISWLFLALGLAAGAALPSRANALTVVLGLAIAGYVLWMLGSAVTALGSVEKVSPFYWADGSHVLTHGFSWLRAGALLAVAAIVLALAVAAFNRRDIAASDLGLLRRLFGRTDLPPADNEPTPPPSAPVLEAVPDGAGIADPERNPD